MEVVKTIPLFSSGLVCLAPLHLHVWLEATFLGRPDQERSLFSVKALVFLLF